ncbi:hypothetical protein B0H14DRAFT_3485428 [Mycena olivaceomarginata]|nr:hypothetical protein B0H14DRAFT_3485428 [Mycena olivaceomarginata]
MLLLIVTGLDYRPPASLHLAVDHCFGADESSSLHPSLSTKTDHAPRGTRLHRALSTSSRLGNMYTLPMAITCALLAPDAEPKALASPPLSSAAAHPSCNPGSGRCESGDSDSAGDEAGLDATSYEMWEREEGGKCAVEPPVLRPSTLHSSILLRPCPCAYQFQSPRAILSVKVGHCSADTDGRRERHHLDLDNGSARRSEIEWGWGLAKAASIDGTDGPSAAVADCEDAPPLRLSNDPDAPVFRISRPGPGGSRESPAPVLSAEWMNARAGACRRDDLAYGIDGRGSRLARVTARDGHAISPLTTDAVPLDFRNSNPANLMRAATDAPTLTPPFVSRPPLLIDDHRARTSTALPEYGSLNRGAVSSRICRGTEAEFGEQQTRERHLLALPRLWQLVTANGSLHGKESPSQRCTPLRAALYPTSLDSTASCPLGSSHRISTYGVSYPMRIAYPFTLRGASLAYARFLLFGPLRVPLSFLSKTPAIPLHAHPSFDQAGSLFSCDRPRVSVVDVSVHRIKSSCASVALAYDVCWRVEWMVVELVLPMLPCDRALCIIVTDGFDKQLQAPRAFFRLLSTRTESESGAYPPLQYIRFGSPGPALRACDLETNDIGNRCTCTMDAPPAGGGRCATHMYAASRASSPHYQLAGTNIKPFPSGNCLPLRLHRLC